MSFYLNMILTAQPVFTPIIKKIRRSHKKRKEQLKEIFEALKEIAEKERNNLMK